MRHGAPRPLSSGVSFRCCCPGCPAVACRAGPDAAAAGVPTHCEAHGSDLGLPSCLPDLSRAPADVLSYSLLFDGTEATSTVDCDAFLLAMSVLGPSPSADVRDRIRWFSELEFRTVSLRKLLLALGMAPRDGAAGGGGASAATAGKAAKKRTEAEVVRETMETLSMGAPAPPLRQGFSHHVCVVHDPSCAPAHAVCGAIRASLEASFAGALVYLPEPPDASDAASDAAAAAAAASRRRLALAETATSSACVFVFLTRGLLARGSPGAAAVAAALAARRRLVVTFESDTARGGVPTVEALVNETAPEAADMWRHTLAAFPWMGADEDFTEVCTLRVLVDGAMEEEGGLVPVAAVHEQ